MDDKVYYFHYRFYTTGWRAFTFAIRKNANSHIEIGTAMCSPKDQFCRKIGREIALGRLNNLPPAVADVKALREHIKNITNDYAIADHIGYVCRKLDN